MATLTPTLTITGTAADFGNALTVSETVNLTVQAPMTGPSTVVATATPGDTTIKAASTGVAYLYVKHSGTTDGSTSTVRQVDVEFTTGEAIARLSANEFLFMPVHHAEENVGVNLHVQHASPSDVVQMEYAFYTKS
jgi:hypothetical protein